MPHQVLQMSHQVPASTAAGPGNKIGLGATGGAVSAGVALEILVSSVVPEYNLYRPVLMGIAPFIPIVATGSWIFLKNSVSQIKGEYDYKNDLKRTEVEIRERLNDRLTSEEHKEKLRARLEELQLIKTDRNL